MQVQVHILVNAQWQIVLKRDGCVMKMQIGVTTRS